MTPTRPLTIRVGLIAEADQHTTQVQAALDGQADLEWVSHPLTLDDPGAGDPQVDVVLVAKTRLERHSDTDPWWRRLQAWRQAHPAIALAVWFDHAAPGAPADLVACGVLGALEWSEDLPGQLPQVIRLLQAGAHCWLRPEERPSAPPA